MRAAAPHQDVVLLDRGAGLGDDRLAATPRLLLLPRTTALGYYDGNLVTAIERLDETGATATPLAQGRGNACGKSAPRTRCSPPGPWSGRGFLEQ